MRKNEYYCDCCEKQVEKESELTFIEISLGGSNGVTHKEVCLSCWNRYMDKMADVAKELFKE